MTPIVGIGFIMGKLLYMKAMRTIMLTYFSAMSVLFIKVYTLKRTIIRAEPGKGENGDVEKGAPSDQDLDSGEKGSAEISEVVDDAVSASRSIEKERETPEGDASDDVTMRPATMESKMSKEYL